MVNKNVRLETVMELALQELTWTDVREEVKAVNSDLAAVIDKLSPNKKFTFFKAHYHYGDVILHQGDFHFPSPERQMVKFRNPDIPANVQEKLSYNYFSNPVSLVLDRHIELFLSLRDRLVSFGVAGPGAIIGLWKALDPAVSNSPESTLWGMTAGVRSTFMLQKISDKHRHSRLMREFQITEEIPHRLIDQWEVFKSLYQHAPSKTPPWTSSVLFFSKVWFDYLTDSAWLEFYHYLISMAWQKSEYWRNQYMWDIIFSSVLEEKRIKPPQYVVDFVKYLFMLCVGVLPAFSPAVDDEKLPNTLLTTLYQEIYGLEHYAPVIMQPQTFSIAHPNDIGYTSIQLRDFMNISQKSNAKSSLVSDLYAIRSLLHKYCDELLKEEYKISTTPLYQAIQQVDFDFFNNDVGKYQEIQECQAIFKDDPRFNLTHNQHVSINSKFLRGCIRLYNRT